MVALRGPTTAEQIVIEVVEKMLKDERKPEVLRLIQHHGVRQLNVGDVKTVVRRLIAATDEDDGVCFGPWETLTLLAYITHLELTLKGERYV